VVGLSQKLYNVTREFKHDTQTLTAAVHSLILTTFNICYD